MPSFIEGYCILVLISYDWHMALNYRGKKDILVGRNESIMGQDNSQQCNRSDCACLLLHSNDSSCMNEGIELTKVKHLATCPESLFSSVGNHNLRGSEHVQYSLQPKGLPLDSLLYLFQLKKNNCAKLRSA